MTTIPPLNAFMLGPECTRLLRGPAESATALAESIDLMGTLGTAYDTFTCWIGGGMTPGQVKARVLADAEAVAPGHAGRLAAALNEVVDLAADAVTGSRPTLRLVTH